MGAASSSTTHGSVAGMINLVPQSGRRVRTVQALRQMCTGLPHQAHPAAAAAAQKARRLHQHSKALDHNRI